MQKMGKFSSNIRFLLLSDVNGGDLVLYKTMFLVAFGENWVSLFANLLCCSQHGIENKRKHVTKQTRGYVETKKTFEFTPLLNVYVDVLCLCFVAQ